MINEKKSTRRKVISDNVRLKPTPFVAAFEKNEVEGSSNKQRKLTFLNKLGLIFLEFVKIALLAGLTIGLVRYFLFKPFYVKGSSMVPTFEQSEYLIVDELTYRFRNPERGEVIVFHAPVGAGDFYLKRIIGLPGERVKIEEKKIIIFNNDYLQGVVLKEPYITEETNGALTITLSDSQFFVLGDNRDASYDSRQFGAIDRKAIIGRAVLRGFPFHKIATFFEEQQYNFKL